MNIEPEYDERDIEDELMKNLLIGEEKMPEQEHEQESVNAFREMFGRAR